MSNLSLAYLEISSNNNILGKLIISLYIDKCPLTCNNFISLCKGINTNNQNLHYKNTLIHRVIKGFMLQTGDFTNNNGTGGLSIYGNKFNDENFIYKHNEKYLLSMANSGPNTNGSQFFITFDKTEWLDNTHVVFGKVVKGMEIIELIQNTPTDENDKPISNIFISDCGIINIDNNNNSDSETDSENDSNNDSNSDSESDVRNKKKAKKAAKKEKKRAKKIAKMEKKEARRIEKLKEKELLHAKVELELKSAQSGPKLEENPEVTPAPVRLDAHGRVVKGRAALHFNKVPANNYRKNFDRRRISRSRSRSPYRRDYRNRSRSLIN